MKRCVEYIAFALCAVVAFASISFAQQKGKKEDSKSLVTNFPVPVGQKGSGVRFPYTENGKKKLDFFVDEMFRKDLGHIQMTKAKIVTYDENEDKDLTLILPESQLDLNTRVLTSDKPFLLIRTNFQMLGASLELNTVERKAKIVGKIKMVIYNLEEPKKKTP